MVPMKISTAGSGNGLLPPPGQDQTKGSARHLIAINDPTALMPLDDLIRSLGLTEYQVVLSTKNAILSAINLSYDFSKDSAEQLVQDMEEDSTRIISEIEDTADLLAYLMTLAAVP